MLPSDNDYYNEQEFNQTADNEGYIDRDDKTIGINTAKGIVNYANLPSPIADSNPDQRSALYGDKKPNHQETAPMLSSPNIRPLLTPSSGAPNGEIMTPSTNPFVYPPSNNTNPFLPNFSSPNNGPYLDMGSNSNLLETDITLRGQNKDSDEILASPPPRYTEVFNDKYFN